MSNINFTVNKEKCIHCGLCEKDCISGIINLDENKTPYIRKDDEKYCLKCQHCLAICPAGAISVCDKNPQDSNICDDNLPTDEQIMNLIQHRKSIRSYKQENLDKTTLQKLKNMLKYSPTGCNNHKLHISIIEDIEVMNKFRDYTNETVKKIILSKIFSPVTKKFGKYKQQFEEGKDIIFRGAPHMVVVSVPIGAPCAPVDPIILLSYFELYAQSLGVGTLWCGFAEIALKLIPELCEYLEIPNGYKVGYVMLFGKTDLKYQRSTQPEDYEISTIEEKYYFGLNIWEKIKRYFWNSLR